MSLEKYKSFELGTPTRFSLHEIRLAQACTINDEIDTSVFNVIWIKDGEAIYWVDFQEFRVKGNTIFFLSPNQIFSVQSEKVETGFQLSFNSDFHCVENHSANIGCNGLLFNNIAEMPFIIVQDENVLRFEGIFNEMIQEFEERKSGYEDMIHVYLNQLLIEATRRKTTETVQQYQVTTGDLDIVKRYSVLVEKNFKKMHSVTEYAQLMGLAPKTLSKQFSKLNAQSPSQMIKERLVLEAKRMLKYSDDSVKEICYELGFEDTAYFSRFFKKNTGESPLSFKAQL